MNVKQFLCAGMTGALLVAGLTACAPGAPEVDPSDVAYQTAGVTRDTVLFTVDGTEVTADEYLFWLLQSVASAKQSGYLADDDAWEEELNGVPHGGVSEGGRAEHQRALHHGVQPRGGGGTDRN